MTPLLYHGLNFSIDTILGYFYKIDYIGVILGLYVVKVICAMIYWRINLQIAGSNKLKLKGDAK